MTKCLSTNAAWTLFVSWVVVPTLTNREEIFYPAGKAQSYSSYLYLQKCLFLPPTGFLEFWVISRLAQGALISEEVKKDWTIYWPLGYTASYWPPTRLHATDD